MTKIRPEKVANAIRKEMSSIIQEELKDPRIGFTTVTSVKITDDLRFARIYYSVMGDKKTRKATEVAMNNAKGYIRKEIGERLGLRFVPEIRLVLDRTYEHQDKIDEILDNIHKDKDIEKN